MVWSPVIGILMCVLHGCTGEPPPQTDYALTSFNEQISSTVHELSMRRNASTRVPVVIRNGGDQPWSSRGKAPVVVSYKWFSNGVMLPIEGKRTGLPRPIAPGESVPVDVTVVAPPQSGRLLLKITLVQEGVAWFMSRGGQPLEIWMTLS
jgi:hypothetical protein